MASEFVTMAAHLMYIKTRMLLSLEDEEAKNEMDALIQSLAERQRGEAYARVRRLAELLGPMGEFGRSILTRDPEPMERGKVYEYDQQLADLVIAMQEVTDRRGQAETPPLRAFDEIVRREPYSVEQKAKEIVRRLKEGGITRFLLLFRGSRSRSEVVATFLAVLELCSALGRYDLDGENRMLDLTAKRLQAALARCEAEKRPRAKCYAALGLCTGLALLILAV